MNKEKAVNSITKWAKDLNKHLIGNTSIGKDMEQLELSYTFDRKLIVSFKAEHTHILWPKQSQC